MKKNKLFVSLLAAGMLVISPAMADDVVKISTNKQAGETVSLQVNWLALLLLLRRLQNCVR